MIERLEGEFRGRRWTAEYGPRDRGTSTVGPEGIAVNPRWRVTWDGVTREMEDLPYTEAEWVVRGDIERWLGLQADAGRWEPGPGAEGAGRTAPGTG